MPWAAKGYGHAHLKIKGYTINTLEDCFIGDVDWRGLDPGRPQEWKNNKELLYTFINKELVQAFREKCQHS